MAGKVGYAGPTQDEHATVRERSDLQVGARNEQLYRPQEAKKVDSEIGGQETDFLGQGCSGQQSSELVSQPVKLVDALSAPPLSSEE